MSGQWGVSGDQYARTLDSWLERMDGNSALVVPIMQATYRDQWRRWLLNWRLFFIVCSETFAARKGSEWAVSHYLFSKRQ